MGRSINTAFTYLYEAGVCSRRGLCVCVTLEFGNGGNTVLRTQRFGAIGCGLWVVVFGVVVC